MTFSVGDIRATEFTELLEVQHRAFGRVADAMGLIPEHLPPLQETVVDLEGLHAAGTRFFVARDENGRVIGGVRSESSGGVVSIGRLVVDDGWERRGVATALMDAVEAASPDAMRFELFTGAEAEGPLRLYRQRGYVIDRVEHHGAVELVWLVLVPSREPDSEPTHKAVS